MNNPLRTFANWFRGSRQATDAHTAPGFWGEIYGMMTASGTPVSEQKAMTYSAVWAATRLLSGTIGCLPLDLYRRRPDGGRDSVIDDPREILVHDRPNYEMSAMSWRASCVGQQVNAGNAYSEIERDIQGNPVALWPIHHTRVRVLRDDVTDDLYYEVKLEGKEPLFLPANDVLHVPSMISDDGIVGKGVIKHARESIGFGLATEKYGSAWFEKGGIPRVVVTHPGKPSSEARSNFRKEWNEIHGGPNGSKIALAAEGMDVKPLNISAEDSQFLETRQHNIEEIARWYGVPPHMIQHLLRATFNNIEHQQIEFVTFSLLPWLKLWEQELWAKLLKPDEQAELYFEFNVNALLRGDAQTRSEFYRSMVQAGIMSPNEPRKLENLNPYDGGDKFYMQGAMVPVDLMAEKMQAEINKANQPPAPPAVPQGPGTAAKELAIKRAASAMLLGGLNRMIRKEATAARQASKKPDEFLAWMDAFYGRHEAFIAESIEHAVTAMAAVGVECEMRQIAIDLCEESKAGLLKVAGGSTTANLAEHVDNLATDWEQHRARNTVAKLFGKDLAA